MRFVNGQGSYHAPPGSRIQRSITQDVETSQQSSRSHQVFSFGGEEVSPLQDEGFHYSRDHPMDSEEDEFPGRDIDHPHMRSSLDSERGVPFLSELHSPTGSQPGDIAGQLSLQCSELCSKVSAQVIGKEKFQRRTVSDNIFQIQVLDTPM